MAKAQETAEPAQGNTAGFVGKITVGTCGFKTLARRAAADKKEVLIGDIVGLASSLKATQLENGDPSIALMGSFEATNAETGETLQAGVCYLPSALSGLVVAIARELQKENPTPQGFAVRLTAFPAENPVGYSYKAENLAPSLSVDPLAAVKAALAPGGYKALPKPAAKLENK